MRHTLMLDSQDTSLNVWEPLDIRSTLQALPRTEVSVSGRHRPYRQVYHADQYCAHHSLYGQSRFKFFPESLCRRQQCGERLPEQLLVSALKGKARGCVHHKHNWGSIVLISSGVLSLKRRRVFRQYDSTLATDYQFSL